MTTKPRTLRAVQPETVEPRKPKVLIYGPPGVGKTWTALDFPGVYYFDHEGGADLDHYRQKLRASGGMYFGPDQGALDFETVIQEVQTLATTAHDRKTMVFDSATKLFNTAIVEEQERLGAKDAFGASKRGPVRQMSRLVSWVNRADMNAIFICHQKDKWQNNEAIGHTFDCWEKLEYELHLVMRIERAGDSRYARVGKTRLLGFPENERFSWSYDEFSGRYGRDVIEREAAPLTLATAQQVADIARLLDVVKLPDGTVEKWLSKAGVEKFDEMDADVIGKCIDFLKGKLS